MVASPMTPPLASDATENAARRSPTAGAVAHPRPPTVQSPGVYVQFPRHRLRYAMDIAPFAVNIPDSVLTDLKERLTRTRWPDQLPDAAPWEYGTDAAYAKGLVEYWRTRFDWRARERYLNSFPNFRANVGGMGIHFARLKGRGRNPLPIILTYGWPSTYFEELKFAGLLADPASHGADPADSFDVVVPSLPGYGFSDITRRRGVNTAVVADLWAQLMTEGLGYTRFGAHGGDWGAAVTTRLGYARPGPVAGIHITLIGAQPNPTPPESDLSEREKQFLVDRADWQDREGGYSHIQGTKHPMLAYGLNDSPAALAAWIVHHFRAWSDCGRDVERRFSKDDLLTTVTIYWVTQT
ncbi:MAG: epoxide hydrolase 1, partial [SAR202 cluster bacterium]|nr:epoxide hydrolase 1 [SAR202 cluster bacterium]